MRDRARRGLDTAAAPSGNGSPVPRQFRPDSQSLFKLVAGDFKNFFSTDTAQVMSYFAVAAVAAAPWDREGVNNGFNIPTTVFQGGNVAGSFVFQIGAGAATYGLGRSFGNAKTATAGRDIVRAQILSQVLVQGLKVHGPPRAARRQQQPVVSFGACGERVCDGRRAPQALRLEGRRARVRVRLVRRPRADVVEQASRHRRRNGCGPRPRVGPHGDDERGRE